MIHPLSRPIFAGKLLAALVALATGAFAPRLGAQDSVRQPTGASGAASARAIPVASLAGQTVSVLPMTLVAAAPALEADARYAPYRDHHVARAWADSTIGAALAERGPEASWVLPPALRKIARRSPGMVKDPDELGQALLRSPRLKEVPEPLRAELRKLVAVAGGRAALVPAALTLAAAAGDIRANLTLVLVDARGGKVLWRAVVSGTGGTPDAALDAALAVALPLDLPTP